MILVSVPVPTLIQQRPNVDLLKLHTGFYGNILQDLDFGGEYWKGIYQYSKISHLLWIFRKEQKTRDCFFVFKKSEDFNECF